MVCVPAYGEESKVAEACEASSIHAGSSRGSLGRHAEACAAREAEIGRFINGVPVRRAKQTLAGLSRNLGGLTQGRAPCARPCA